jgi:hypothetical protein
MRICTLSQVILWLAVAGLLPPAHAMSREELVSRLEAAGYTEVSDIKSTAEGIVAKATKNSRHVRLVVDSGGQIKEQN